MRIVIDTNIWVSGLLWKGKPWRLLQLAEEQVIELCIAYPMLLELEEVLAYERFAPRLTILQQTPAQLASYALNRNERRNKATCPGQVALFLRSLRLFLTTHYRIRAAAPICVTTPSTVKVVYSAPGV